MRGRECPAGPRYLMIDRRGSAPGRRTASLNPCPCTDGRATRRGRKGEILEVLERHGFRDHDGDEDGPP